MNKAEFLLSLRQGMEGLPKDEVEASLAFSAAMRSCKS